MALESTRSIDIETFVANDSVDWIWHEKLHFPLADDKVGMGALRVIRDVMAASEVVGIVRLLRHKREHAVLLEPRGRGIILWTLRYGDELIVRPRNPLQSRKRRMRRAWR